ncbi:MAG TPA: dipeptidyl aminopeptidase, partial [Alistipes obesi]|nr:dipeptidyl aminopeptidase [Alistipes communis]
IAYLRFDESRVPLFEMMRYDGALYNRAYDFKYPKAGDANSVVTLHVFDLETGRTTKVDTGADTTQYIPRIGWT